MKENNKNGFKVPEDYFKEFEQRIPEIIKKHNGIKKSKSFSIYYTIAASIILLAVSSIIFIPKFNINESNINPYELSDAEYFDLKVSDLYYAYNEEANADIVTNNNEEVENYIADEMDLDEIIMLSE